MGEQVNQERMGCICLRLTTLVHKIETRQLAVIESFGRTDSSSIPLYLYVYITLLITHVQLLPRHRYMLNLTWLPVLPYFYDYPS